MMVMDDEVIWGQEGVYQGDPIGGRVHDTGLQPVLVQVAQEVSDRYPKDQVYIIAFRDDVHFVRPVDPVVWTKNK